MRKHIQAMIRIAFLDEIPSRPAPRVLDQSVGLSYDDR